MQVTCASGIQSRRRRPDRGTTPSAPLGRRRERPSMDGNAGPVSDRATSRVPRFETECSGWAGLELSVPRSSRPRSRGPRPSICSPPSFRRRSDCPRGRGEAPLARRRRVILVQGRGLRGERRRQHRLRDWVLSWRQHGELLLLVCRLFCDHLGRLERPNGGRPESNTIVFVLVDAAILVGLMTARQLEASRRRSRAAQPASTT